LSKKTKALIATVIGVGVAIEILVMALLNPVMFTAAFPFLRPELNFGPVEETVHLTNQTATRIGMDLNISMRITKDLGEGGSVAFNEFQINKVSQQNITGLTVSLNGTFLDNAVPLNFALKAGDNVEACLTLPSTSLPASQGYQEGLISVAIMTPECYYYKEMPMPP
jgi:hypothetical protein